ncbi:hypothetical protein, partial [Pseudooceanicola nanhaiensis]
MRAAVAEAARTEGEGFRARLVALLQEANETGRAAIAEAFTARPFAAEQTTRAYTWLTDCIVLTTVEAVRDHVAPETGTSDFAVIA